MDIDKLKKEFYENLPHYMHHEVHSVSRALAMLIQFKSGTAVEHYVEDNYLNIWLGWDEIEKDEVRKAIATEKEVKKELVKHIEKKLLIGDKRQRRLLKHDLICGFDKAVRDCRPNFNWVVKWLSKHTKDRLILTENVKAVEDLYIDYIAKGSKLSVYKRILEINAVLNEGKAILVWGSDNTLNSYDSFELYLLYCEKRDDMVDILLGLINSFKDYESLAKKMFENYASTHSDMTVGGFKKWLKGRCRADELDRIIEELILERVENVIFG